MSTIFLSYARGDDEPFVRRLYDDLLKVKFDVWFDRVNMPSRGLTFHQEIREAITDRDRLLVVVGPQAVKSEYVRQEWQYAWFDAEKVVTPILRLGDYPLPIPELTLLHCEDFRNDGEYQAHLKELIRILQEPAPPMGKVIGAPALPAHFLTRTDRLISLRDALRSGLDSPAPLGGTATHHHFHGIASVSRQVGLHGMGGIGKSVLANLLARDREVRKAFPDGIVWIGLGSLPNIVSLMQRVHQQLGGDGLFSSEHEGQQKLKELLAQKAALLVIDDVWRRQDVDAFNVLGPRCRALITTRDAGLLTSIGGTHHLLQLLTDEEALRLLAVAVGVEAANLPIDAHEVLAECGRLPLAIALAGGMAKSGVSWSDIRDALREHDLEYISDEHRSEAQHQSLWRMIEVSVNALTAEEQQRLVELVVFPEDATVPEAGITTLWETTGNVSPRHARKLLTNLKQRSLIQLVEDNRSSSSQPVDSHFFLHDLIHDYGVARHLKSNGDLKALHSKLLSAYEAKAPHGWWSGPNDGYYFQNLRHHLIAAGRDDDSLSLLMDFDWLQAKTHAGLITDLCREMIDAGPATDLRSIDGLGPWYFFVRSNALFLNEHPNCFFQQAFNEPRNSTVALTALSRRAIAPAFLELVHRPDEWQPPALIMTLTGHSPECIALSADAATIASGGWDKNVRLWDSANGRCGRILSGHESGVSGVAWSGDGRAVVTGSHDKTVRLWDTRTGQLHTVLSGHDASILCVALTGDGKTIASGDCAGEVRVWDTETGQCRFVLKAPTERPTYNDVQSVAISADGSILASGSRDSTVSLWDTATGQLRLVLVGHADSVTGVALSADDLTLVSGSKDGSVRMWDTATGKCLTTLFSSHDAIDALALSIDGTSLAIGCHDKTVRVLNLATCKILATLSGHHSYIKSISVSDNGKTIVSASSADQTIRVWDANNRQTHDRRSGHQRRVNSLVLSSDQETVVSGSDDGTVRVWDVATGNCRLALSGHQGIVKSVALSGDGSTLVSGGYDGTVRVWDARTGRCHAELFTLEHLVDSEYLNKCYDCGETFVSKLDDKLVYRFDKADDKYELLGFGEYSDNISCVATSVDGYTVISGTFHGKVRVWDVRSGLCRGMLSAGKERISNLFMSADGTEILSYSDGGTLRLWSVESGQCLKALQSLESDECLALLDRIAPETNEGWWRILPGRLQVMLRDGSRPCTPGVFEKAIGSQKHLQLVGFTADGEDFWFRIHR